MGGCRFRRTASDPTTATQLESGQWWALYYPGIQTLVSTTADMAARAQAIRRHNYAMRGMRVPAHAIPPAPTLTSVHYGPTSFLGRIGARVYWEGSAGAVNYSVERARAAERAVGHYLPAVRHRRRRRLCGRQRSGEQCVVSRSCVQPRRKARACLSGDARLNRLGAVTRPRRRARSRRRRAVRRSQKRR